MHWLLLSFILLILANVNVEAKTATVTNLKETDIEPYENPDITLTWDAVSSGDQTIYYRLEISEDKITWKDEGSYYEPTAKIHAPSGKSVFMRVSAPTQLLTTMPIWTIKISVILETGLTP